MSVVIKGIQMFCNFGGPYVAPIILPIFGLINILALPMFCSLWLVLLLSIFLPVYTSNVNVLNSGDHTNKNAGRAFGFSFLIYYVIMISIFCSVMQGMCRAKDAAGL